MSYGERELSHTNIPLIHPNIKVLKQCTVECCFFSLFDIGLWHNHFNGYNPRV